MMPKNDAIGLADSLLLTDELREKINENSDVIYWTNKRVVTV